MFATRFLPKFFKEVMTHIPTLALKSMDWKGLLKELGPMAGRMGRRSLEADAMQSLRELNTEGVQIVSGPVVNNYGSLTQDQKKDCGQAVLRLYFNQLNNSEGLCLDLRPKHFRREDGTTCFSPNNVWFHFNQRFRTALIDLYKGFYHDNDELFDSALEGIGLTRNLSNGKKARLKELFLAHFGPGAQDEVFFRLEDFQESFYELFKFFVDNEVSLDKDFMFLGVYLVGLYMNLESLGTAVDVREAFTEVFPAAGGKANAARQSAQSRTE